MRSVFIIVLSTVVMAQPSALLAQESQQPVRVEQPRNFAADVIQGQKDLWTSPIRVHRRDAAWLLPLTAGAAALIATDHRISDAASHQDGIRPVSRMLSKFGGGVTLGIASGSLYGWGKLTGNSKIAETGTLAGAAVLHSGLVTTGLKAIFNRERPDKIDGQGQFWGGGRSFPSGHAATSFSFATVVAGKYRNKPLIAVSAYGLATAVSFSRVGGQNHFPSDVLIGAAIGHLIGRYVLHQHKHEYID